MADADPHPAKIRAQMRIDRTQAIMPRRTATLLDLDLHRRQIQLVVEHRQRRYIELVKAHGFRHRAAAFVHEGRRFQQDDAARADAAIAQPTGEFLLLRGKAVHFGDGVCCHEADIVAVQRILLAGIA